MSRQPADVGHLNFVPNQEHLRATRVRHLSSKVADGPTRPLEAVEYIKKVADGAWRILGYTRRRYIPYFLQNAQGRTDRYRWKRQRIQHNRIVLRTCRSGKDYHTTGPATMKSRLFVTIATIVTLAAVSPASHRGYAQDIGIGSESTSVAELARQLQETQRQLEQTQMELDSLQQRDVERRQWEASMMRRLPPAESSHRMVSDSSDAYKDDGTCGDCGKSVCEGIPHVCACCLEGLSWNKAGGWRIVPFGMLRGEVIYSQQEQAADAIIFFLAPDATGVDDDQFTAHAKTSMLNFDITGPNIGSWQTGGAFVMNFTGSQPLRNTSGPQVLNAYGEIKNDDWRFSFGRMFDLFSPITTNTVNMGQQRAAGNVGIYRGGMQIDRYLNVSGDTRWTLSGRVAQPVASDYLLLPTARGTDNGIPNFEWRAGLELGPEIDGQRALEIGVSGLWGEAQAFDAARFVVDQNNQLVFLPAISNVSTTAGGCLDFQLHGERFGINGEFWVAKTAGTYFVAVLQTLNPATGNGIRSIGGWGEVYYKLNDCTTFYVGYGVDDPRNQDVGFLTDGPAGPDPNDPGQRTFNQVVWANILWDVTDFFQLGFEVSHRETRYVNPFASDDGMLFHFSSTLKY